MSIKQARELGGKYFKEQWGPSLLAILLACAGMIVATVAVLGLGGLIAAGPIMVGLLYVYYQASQGKEIVYTDMLCGFKTNFGEIVLGVLLKEMFVYGVFIVAYLFAAVLIPFVLVIPVFVGLFIGAIGVVAIVAVIIISLHLAAVEYILMREPDAKGWEAVKKSKRIMNGNKGKLFGFTMSYFGWFVLTAIFFPLAIYMLPYYFMARTIFIGSIYDEAERRAAEPIPVPQAAPAPAPVPQAAPAPAPQAGVKFCKHCGAKMDSSAAFCPECGKPQE